LYRSKRVFQIVDLAEWWRFQRIKLVGMTAQSVKSVEELKGDLVCKERCLRTTCYIL
jgi:hypothetical protein